MKSAEISEIVCLVNEALPLIKTDLSNGQILSYAVAALPFFPKALLTAIVFRQMALIKMPICREWRFWYLICTKIVHCWKPTSLDRKISLP